MANPDSQSGRPGESKSRRDRWIKLLLGAVVIAAALGVYVAQLRPPKLPDYFSAGGLAAALEQAQPTRRTVLVLFWTKPANEPTRFVLGGKGLKQHQVREAVKKGKHLCVAVKVDRKLQSETAKKYRLKRLPTLVVLSPDGGELSRREGKVGHAEIYAMLTEAISKFQKAS